MLTTIELGTIVGSFPCFAMLFASIALTQIKLTPNVEAACQNFCGGLILGAVAAELFPLILLNDDVSKDDAIVGLSIGIPVALFFIHGVEYLVELAGQESTGGENVEASEQKLIRSDYTEIETEMTPAIVSKLRDEKWETEPVIESYNAIIIPAHKKHIREHLEELFGSISKIEAQSITLSTKLDLGRAELEEIAEAMDEEIHRVQYKLDHTRRLLQGAETNVSASNSASWVTEEKKLAMREKSAILKHAIGHLLEHIADDRIDLDTLEEMHEHIDDMDEQITNFHETVEKGFSRWRRSRPMIEPPLGAEVPTALILPVLIDAFVDGFLIGISVALQPTAGYILAGANCLEMSFLGIALTIRVVKCTGSSFAYRSACIASPPLLMLLASTIGAAVGCSALSLPMLYVGFVSFGIVALLFLVCDELLIEAKNAQGEDEQWWVGVMIFAGIYVVLMLDLNMPSS